jgi:chromosome segregation ATPase
MIDRKSIKEEIASRESIIKTAEKDIGTLRLRIESNKERVAELKKQLTMKHGH